MAATATPIAQSSQQFNRFDLSQPTKAVRPPSRLAIIGEPGVGKTTFASCAPDVVIVPTEDGALGVDVDRFPRDGKCETWEQLMHALTVLAEAPHNYQHVAVDTGNGAYALCAQYVCTRDFGGNWNAKGGKEGFNQWGQGEKATAAEFRQMLTLLDRLQQQRGMGVILLNHVGLHKQGNALGADFQKLGGEMGKQSWALMCAWADQVGYACRDLLVSQDDKKKAGKAAAIGNERWLVFEGGPALDAKSRVGYEMPERILLSWEEYQRAMNSDRAGELVKQAQELLAAAPEGMRETVAGRLEGGAITNESLRALGVRSLEQLIGWALSKTHNQSNQEK